MNDDPKFKWDLMQAMLHCLYNPFKEMQLHELKTIIVQNSLLHKNDQKVFRYKGQIYYVEGLPQQHSRTNRLHPSLFGRMKDFLSLSDQVHQEESPYVTSALQLVLNSSDNIDDYYRLLPESLHCILDDFRPIAPVALTRLTDEQVADICLKNQKAIGFMKARMAMNLLI